MRRTIESIIQLELLNNHLKSAKEICLQLDLDTLDDDEVALAMVDDIKNCIEFFTECQNKKRSELPELQE